MPMTTRFENAPLIEVVAELRWNTSQDSLFQQAMPGIAMQLPEDMNVSAEKFFARFSALADEHGFRNTERLFPYGTPLVPGQAALRFRRKAGQPPLMQVGSGVFTANGLPPTYTHWGDFVPILQQGVESLLRSRDDAEKGNSFTSTVRYIDAFSDEFWLGSDPGRFITDVLGFALSVPSTVLDKLHTDRPLSVGHQLNLPMGDGSNLTISVGEGVANNNPAVILEVVVQKSDVPPEIEAIMSQFWSSHNLIRELFLEMTAKVRGIMQPVEVDAE
jgi:uncharacterized protein (TIGR04255 family)